MNQLFSVSGKTILVTGGTRGIGLAITKALAEAGATVIANYVRDQKSAEALQAELGDKNVSIVRADLSREKGMDKLFEALQQTLGGETLDGLVHCAATGIHAPFDQLQLKHWDWTMNLNVRAFFDLMARAKNLFTPGASVIALSSEGAAKAIPNYSLVGASKGALESLCRHLAIEMSSAGVRINVLSPGSVLTDAWNAFPDKDERLQIVLDKIPGGKLTSLAEVSSVALFLCSDASRAINGQVIIVDHGERISG
jgi:enoyl-[acyl-carrier protein] reductase III